MTVRDQKRMMKLIVATVAVLALTEPASAFYTECTARRTPSLRTGPTAPPSRAISDRN